MKDVEKSTLDDLFVDITHVMAQKNHEDQFRGHVLSMFANLESTMARIISVHNSLEVNYWKYFLETANNKRAADKIRLLAQILKQKIYENPNHDFEDLVIELKDLNKKRNQLAHNIIDPLESNKSTREKSYEITLLVMKKGKVMKTSFGIKEQNELIEKLNHVYSQLKDIHRFIKEKNDYTILEWYP